MKTKNKDSGSQAQERTLIHIPIIHTQEDMGSFSELIREASLKEHGEKSWNQKVWLINEIWGEIDRIVTSLDLKDKKVRLYQDGLPVCGRELEIVTDVARTGSLNHQLLLRLIKSGATLMGTESADLLLEEYNLVKNTLVPGNVEEAATPEVSREKVIKTLLKKRDQYIAGQINTTLAGGETGILFLGMLHSIENLLNKDIRVKYPFIQPRGDITVLK
ncbi:hypothetical protein JWG39_10635 [Desulforhopalus vacuolatus]|uniref:hypothetical protein n=1 Tax=Desulforhopalus vacuolatus TaxID=40414 RepID=UPI0019653251|nr:hypothetical protein [Desulforhopalus vacuolatus]MBM9520270.1 hypothetical protein [Desulforhopalus vacuolatus]